MEDFENKDYEDNYSEKSEWNEQNKFDEKNTAFRNKMKSVIKTIEDSYEINDNKIQNNEYLKQLNKYSSFLPDWYKFWISSFYEADNQSWTKISLDVFAISIVKWDLKIPIDWFKVLADWTLSKDVTINWKWDFDLFNIWKNWEFVGIENVFRNQGGGELKNFFEDIIKIWEKYEKEEETIVWFYRDNLNEFENITRSQISLKDKQKFVEKKQNNENIKLFASKKIENLIKKLNLEWKISEDLENELKSIKSSQELQSRIFDNLNTQAEKNIFIRKNKNKYWKRDWVIWSSTKTYFKNIVLEKSV